MQALRAIQTEALAARPALHDVPGEQGGWQFRRVGEVDPVLTVNARWLSRCRGVQVGGGKGLPLEQRVPVAGSYLRYSGGLGAGTFRDGGLIASG